MNFKQFLENKKQTEMPSSPWYGGWKIHLRTGTDNNIRDKAYAMIRGIIKHSGNNKWLSKKLSGGEEDQKDITIYCGSKQEAIKAANAIKDHQYLYSLILPPNTEVLQDDILIVPNIPNIYGRFEASRLNTAPATFHQYGCKGWSMLKSDMEKKTMARSTKIPFDSEKACQKSYNILSKLFGTYFTG